MFEWYEITYCRACGCDSLVEVLDMGRQYVVTFITAGELPAWKQGLREVPIPLTLVMCNECKFVQLRQSVDPDRLYRYFWYRSGTNESMRATLNEIVREAIAKVGYVNAALDIGSNDGTLLSYYPSRTFKVGYDPAKNLVAEARKTARTPYIYADYFPPEATPIDLCSVTYQIITAISMFYDLEDPYTFLQECRNVLTADGVIVIQMNYLLSMLQHATVDNIAHEHLGYYSLQALSALADKCGLFLRDATLNGTNGGSIRVYLSHKGSLRTSQEAKNVEDLLLAEQAAGLDQLETWVRFRKLIGDRLHAVSYELSEAYAVGKRIYLYGASTRGSTLMQLLDFNPECITGAAERNPEKYGLHMVGTWIPIVSEEEARQKADLFLVLPWHFKDSILQRERETLEHGVQFLFPLPIPTLYTVKQLV